MHVWHKYIFIQHYHGSVKCKIYVKFISIIVRIIIYIYVYVCVFFCKIPIKSHLSTDTCNLCFENETKIDID